MNKPISNTKERQTAPKAADSSFENWLNQPAPSKPSVNIPRLGDVEKEEETKRSADEAPPQKKQKLGTGLEAVLQAARGDNTPNTLDKTKESWRDYKKDKEVAQELDSYKKDKDRYTDKVAFLERSSHREWEVEQAGKKRR